MTKQIESEIRAVFLTDDNIYVPAPDWNLIAQTCVDYGINTIVAGVLGFGSCKYTSQYIVNTGSMNDELALCLQAAHARGIKVWVLDCVVLALGGYQSWEEFGSMYWDVNTQTLVQDRATCPTKAHDRILNLIQELITTHPDIDGFMYDFIRYEGFDWCYCPQCQAKFEAWLIANGKLLGTWPTDFVSTGSRNLEFQEWRCGPITDLVRQGSMLLRDAKPDIHISVASWVVGLDCPIYFKKYLGQDTALWIKEGCVDSVSAMMYARPTESWQSFFDNCINGINQANGGVNGKIQHIPFLRWDYDSSHYPRTPAQNQDFINQIEYVRSKGCNGWIVFRYGGPGDSPYNPAQSVLDFLQTMKAAARLWNTFTLSDVVINKTAYGIEVTWNTSLPTTGKVEYSLTPLFNSQLQLWRGQTNELPFWEMTRNTGIEVATELGPATLNHKVTIPTTSDVYLRVQSADPSNTTSSEVFHTGLALPEGPATPYSQRLEEGTYKITIPSTFIDQGKTYLFQKWEDETTNPVRTLTLTADTTIMATYSEQVTPPPPPPPPPTETMAARSIGPLAVPAALLHQLWRLRERFIRPEVHRKLHPLV
jgi:uncharacterized lipoprotein YddW (UPF0748 family)